MTFEQCWMIFIGAVITAAVGAISSYAKELRLKHEQEQIEKDKTIELLMTQNEELKKWRTTTEERMADLVSDFKKMSKHVENMTGGGMAILRDRIVQSCRVFMERGKIPLAERDNIRGMYKWYSMLGGNGVGEFYYNQMMKLPIDDTPSVPHLNINYEDVKEYMDEKHL